jgi:hypothetical protein
LNSRTSSLSRSSEKIRPFPHELLEFRALLRSPVLF